MAGDDRLVIFISSSMDELKPERKAVRSAIKAMKGFEPFAWESDAAADNHSAQEEWTKQLARSDVTIVVLWQKLGQWTKDEIDISRDRGIPILLFRKRDEQQTLERTEGAYLAELENPETGVAAKYFRSDKKLKKFVDQGLWSLIKDRFSAARERDLNDKDELRGLRRTATATGHGLSMEEAAGPSIRRRDPAEVRHLPPNRWTFVGRAAEKGKLMRAFGTGDQVVAVVGVPGIGKKALLKDVTYHEDLDADFPDGAAIYPSRADQENLEDLLQAIWEELYDVDDPSVVEPHKRRRQLGDKKALVFLPDLELPPDQLEQLLDEMPPTVFCVTASESSTPGKQVRVEGFADPEESLALFAAHYRGAIPEAARADIVSMCGLLDGNPSLIGLLADRAWGDAEDVPDEPGKHPLIPWAAAHRQMTAEELRDWLVPSEVRRAVGVAQETGVHTPRAVMVDVAGSADPVDDALADRLLEAASPRYRANAALVPDAPTDDALMGEVFDSALSWANAATADEVYADRAFVLRMMEWGTARERWRDVLDLGTATEAPLALGGRHGVWEQVLQLCLGAARSMEPVDEGAEAWALHQLGSRALLRDELGDARVLLHQSLRRRPETDAEGRAVTRRNLGLIPAAIVSGGVLLLWLVFIASWGTALVAAAAPLDMTLNVSFDESVPAPATAPVYRPTAPFQVATGDAAVVGVAIVAESLDGRKLTEGESSFCVVVEDACLPGTASVEAAGEGAGAPGAAPVTGRPLALAAETVPSCEVRIVDGMHLEAVVPGDSGCFLTIGFQPRTAGTYEAGLELVVEGSDSVSTGTLLGEGTMAISEIDPDIESFEAANERKPFELTNVGGETFSVGVIDAVPPGFDLHDDDCSGESIEPGASCGFTVEFLGDAATGPLELELIRTGGTGSVQGDDTIVLVGKP